MHIENQDALKSWLTPVLEPLCDADPTALAKYVVALLKKDKPQVELYGCMAEQLDVFLGVETKPFLEKLFEVIKNQDYVNIVASNITSSSSSTNQEPVIAESSQNTSAVNQGTNNSRKTITKDTTSSGGDVSKDDRVVSSSSLAKQAVTSPNNKSKSQEPQSSQQGHPRDSIRRRRISNRSRSKSRTRSKSPDRMESVRNRRSRSRDRPNYSQRDKSQRYRDGGDNSSRRYDHRSGKNDRGSPKPYRNAPARRSRTRSNSPTYNRKPSPKHHQQQQQQQPPSIPMQTPSQEKEFYENKSKRCRDFDEKGYCMRGETCPWDHGMDPVVLEDLNNPQLGINAPVAAGLNIRAPIHSEYNPDAPDLWSRGPGFPQAARMMIPAPRQPYFGFRGGPGMAFNMPGAGLPRELISVPVMDPNMGMIGNDAPPHMKRRFEGEDGNNMNDGPKRKIPIGARLGARVNHQGGGGGNQNPQQNCSLELRKIPRGLNAISHLNDHFSRFGKITNIQIAYENDPEAAIVTFSSHAEANVAYRSTEAVLNNRFIKVFWHTGTSGDNPMSGPTGSLPKPSELSVRRFPYQPNTTPAAPAEGSAATGNAAENQPEGATVNSDSPVTSSAGPTNKSTTFISSASAAAQQQRIKAAKLNRATSEMIRKKQKEQQKEVVQLAHGILQKKQELVQKNVGQMKQLLEKLEKTDPLDPARPHLMETVRSLQTIIDKLKQELKTDSAQIVAKMQTTTPPQRRTKEQTQKELLDVELELIAKEQHGDNDTYAIQKRYLELQKSLHSGAPTAAHHFTTQGPRLPVARPNVARFGSTSVDRRPTTVKITGFSLDESDGVLGHFKHFGEITKNILDETVPYLVLAYSSRINAEQALARGRQFKDKVLTINWFVETTTKPTVGGEAAKEGEKSDVAASSDDSKLAVESKLADSEKKLSASDDEEIEEEEERSWRRGYDGE